AEAVADAQAPGIKEGQWIDLEAVELVGPVHVEPAPLPAPVGALVELVLATTVDATTSGLVALAHGDSSSLHGLTFDGGASGARRDGAIRSRAGHAASRSAARNRALRALGLAMTSASSGTRPFGVTRRSRGCRPHTQTGASGGHVHPRRSAW